MVALAIDIRVSQSLSDSNLGTGSLYQRVSWQFKMISADLQSKQSYLGKYDGNQCCVLEFFNSVS